MNVPLLCCACLVPLNISFCCYYIVEESLIFISSFVVWGLHCGGRPPPVPFKMKGGLEQLIRRQKKRL